MKKKKPKGAEDKKAGEDDENALVDNEEANIEDVCYYLILHYHISYSYNS